MMVPRTTVITWTRKTRKQSMQAPDTVSDPMMDSSRVSTTLYTTLHTMTAKSRTAACHSEPCGRTWPTPNALVSTRR